MAYRLGVDVGGTFTDLFLVDDGDHRQWRVKTPSTPRDPSQGVLDGVERICEEAGIAPARPRQRRPRHDRRHQRGARVQGRPRRPDHDAGLRPDPAPRALADAGPAGRLDHHGQARPAGLAGRHARGGRADGRARATRSSRSTASRSRRSSRTWSTRGVESLTISLINSYVDGAPRAGDRRPRRGAVSRLPGHASPRAVLPEFREYERTLTACMNSYVRPRVAAATSTACRRRCATSA